jgi:ABC-type transport system substrate-binding protein
MSSVKITLKLLLISLILISISAYPRNRVGTLIRSGVKDNINEPEPFFHTNILTSLNPFFAHYSHILARELEKIGISCDVHLVNSGTVGLRTRLNWEGTQYKDGGFDIAFFIISWDDWKLHPGKSLYNQHIPLSEGGSNFYFWSSIPGDNNYRADEAEALIQTIVNNLNYTDVQKDLLEYQRIYYDVMPAQEVLVFSRFPFAISTGLYGLDPKFHPLSSLETMWNDSTYLGLKGEIVFATESISNTFNPALNYDWWTKQLINPVMDRLVGFTPSREVVLPVETNRETWMDANFGTSNFLDVYPRVASELGTFSNNGLQYNITVQDDVVWHDGHPLDAWDVAFSYQAYLIPELNNIPHLKPQLQQMFGDDDKDNHYGLYSFIVEDKNTDGFYESVCFNFLNESSAYLVEPELLTLPLLPEHILGDPIDHGYNGTSFLDPMKQWLVPPTEWEKHSFNTGDSDDPGGLNGPIGCGSVIFKKYNPDGSIIFQKFEDIRWDNTSQAWVNTDPSSDHYLIKKGKLADMPENIEVKILDFDSALEAMKNGSINIIDPAIFNKEFGYWNPQHSHQKRGEIFKEIEDEPALQPVHDYASYRQWLMSWENPRFQTELGDTPFNKKGVRHAISHMIPRLRMCEEVLYGLGTPATSFLQFLYSELSESELISYKRSLSATDGTYPLATSNSPWDSYDRYLALDWLETEGYNVEAWRTYKPPSLPEWLTGDTQQWDSSIKENKTIEFTITKLRDVSNLTEWYWELANVTLHEGDSIKITWDTDPETDNILHPGWRDDGYLEKVNYPISVSIGGKALDANHSQQFVWFVLPLITTNGFDEFEPGILAAERFIPNSFKFVNFLDFFWNHWYFNFDVEGTPSIHDIGGSAAFSDEIDAKILTQNSVTGLEDRVFNLTYDAQTGILKKLIFTNVEGGNSSTGDVESHIIDGLQELIIQGPVKEEPPPTTSTIPTESMTSEPPLDSGSPIPPLIPILGLGGIVSFAIILVVIIRRQQMGK